MVTAREAQRSGRALLIFRCLVTTQHTPPFGVSLEVPLPAEFPGGLPWVLPLAAERFGGDGGGGARGAEEEEGARGRGDLRVRLAPSTTRGAPPAHAGPWRQAGRIVGAGTPYTRREGGVSARACCCVRAGGSPLVLDGLYAEFFPSLSLGWASSTAGIDAVDAVPFMADADLENASELKGKLALVSRDTETLIGARGLVPFWRKAQRAANAGAAGVIIVNTDDDLNEPHGMTDAGSGYQSKIPVLLIKSSDAARLREHGGALIRDKGNRFLVCGRDCLCECSSRVLGDPPAVDQSMSHGNGGLWACGLGSAVVPAPPRVGSPHRRPAGLLPSAGMRLVG